MHLSVLSTVWAVAAVAAAVFSSVAHAGTALRQPHRGPDPEPLVVKVGGAAHFRWGDAGIGATAGFGRVLVLVSGVSLRRAGRSQREEEGDRL